MSQDVADQPGFSRGFKVLIVALLLGLGFRGAFSRDYVTAEARKAAQYVHRDVSIDFDTAELSLADGPFPEFAIVIQNVKMVADQKCWMSPELTVDELRMPVGFLSLFSGIVEIHELALGQVQLQLRTPWQECEPIKTVAEAAQLGDRSLGQKAEERAPFQAPSSRGTISRVSVHSLHVQYLPNPSNTFDLDRLVIHRVSENPLALVTSGELNLGGEALSGDYSSKAQFQIDFSHPELTAKVKGSWREGTYGFDLNSNIEKRTFALQGHTEHLPLSQMIPLLKKYELVKGEYDGRQVWLNLRFQSSHEVVWGERVPVQIERLGIEGDMGQIEGGGFVIRRWTPVEVTPTEIGVHGLQVERLMRLLGYDEKPHSFGDLGVFNGVVKIDDRQRLQLTGEHTGLEFIFSNRGERQTQKISLMAGTFELDKDRWKMKINSIRPLEGLFLGDVTLEGDLHQARTQLKMRVDEMHLGANVQTLMSGGGSLGRWAADVDATWKGRTLDSLTGQILAQDLSVDGIETSHARATLSRGRDGGIDMDIKLKPVTVAESARLRGLLEPLLPEESQQPEGMKAAWQSDLVQMTAHQSPDGSFSWKFKPIQMKGWALRSEGRWDPEGQVDGLASVKTSDRETAWRLEGDRDELSFAKMNKGN